VTNNLLDTVRELEYFIAHFIKKTNKSTALDVRNCSREVTALLKSYKDKSIAYYKDDIS